VGGHIVIRAKFSSGAASTLRRLPSLLYFTLAFKAHPTLRTLPFPVHLLNGILTCQCTLSQALWSVLALVVVSLPVA